MIFLATKTRRHEDTKKNVIFSGYASLRQKNGAAGPDPIGFGRVLFAKVFWKQSSLGTFGFGHVFAARQTRADCINGGATRFSATTEAAACPQQAKQTQQK